MSPVFLQEVVLTPAGRLHISSWPCRAQAKGSSGSHQFLHTQTRPGERRSYWIQSTTSPGPFFLSVCLFHSENHRSFPSGGISGGISGGLWPNVSFKQRPLLQVTWALQGQIFSIFPKPNKPSSSSVPLCVIFSSPRLICSIHWTCSMSFLCRGALKWTRQPRRSLRRAEQKGWIPFLACWQWAWLTAQPAVRLFGKAHCWLVFNLLARFPALFLQSCFLPSWAPCPHALGLFLPRGRHFPREAAACLPKFGPKCTRSRCFCH